MKAQPKKRPYSKSAALILAGGESKRLFPFVQPKPLLKIDGETLLEQCLKRAAHLDERFIVTNAKVASEIRAAFRNVKTPGFRFILEPEARDTAAAVGFALTKVPKTYKWLSILSADQYMEQKASAAFQKRIRQIQKENAKNPESLFLMGSSNTSKPRSEHSRYGWVLPSKVLSEEASEKVQEFVEKPDSKTLARIRKKALINCGMFFGFRDIFEAAFREHYPYAFDLKKIKDYSKLPKKPIDKAIFEKFHSVRLMKMSQAWEDLGTWSSLECHSQGSEHHISSIDLSEKMTSSNFVYTDAETEAYVFDVKNLAVIQSGNRILVMPKDKTGELKKYLDQIKKIKKNK